MRTTTIHGARVALTLAVAGLLGACSDDGDPAADEPPSEVTTADPDDVSAEPSAGCEAPGDVAAEAGPPGQERVTLPSGGQERWYFRHLPEAHDGTTPVPLVLDFHGYSEGAEIHLQMSQLSAYGDAEGFVTITPHGLGEVPRWDPALGGDDLAFVGDLLDQAEATLCVDTSRVYATGLSNGAFLTSAIACQHADRVAAVAPVAGIREVDGCDPARPVPVVTFHGTEDGFVSFDGGLGEQAADLPAPDGSGRTLGELRDEGGDQVAGSDLEPDGPSVPEITAAWAERNGCEHEPGTDDVADDVAVERYACPAGADAELYRVEGGGHTWPGSEFSAGIESIVGPTTMSISANEVMWAFFRDHPLT